jgi:hypothetical protein
MRYGYGSPGIDQLNYWFDHGYSGLLQGWWTADLLDGMEAFVRGTEEKRQTPRFHQL